MMFPVNFYYSLVSSNLGTKTILMIKTNITFVFLKQEVSRRYWGCDRGRIRTVGRALDCRVWGRRFDSWGWINTQDLEITEKWKYFLSTACSQTFAWLGWPHEMACSPVSSWIRKNSVLSWYFCAKYIDTNKVHLCCSDYEDLYIQMTASQTKVLIPTL